MLVFLIFFIVAAQAQASIPIKDVDFQINGDRNTFDSLIRTALDETTLARIAVKGAGGTAGAAVGLIPVAGSALSKGTDALVGAIVQESWENTFIHAIGISTERAIALSRIAAIKASMRTISQHFRDLKDEVSSRSIISIISIIRSDIMTILNIYDDADSVFRKYPATSITPLSTLAPLIVTLDPFIKTYTPDVQSAAFLSCRLHDILLEYRQLLVFKRLTEWEMYNGHSDPRGAGAFSMPTNPYFEPESATEVIYLMHNRDGYIGKNEETIGGCYNGCNNGEDSCGSWMKDRSTERRLFSSTRDMALRRCVNSYLKVLRHLIEKTFDEPADLLSNICTAEVRNQRKPTGNFFYRNHVDIHFQCFVQDLVGSRLSLSAHLVKFYHMEENAMVFGTWVAIFTYNCQSMVIMPTRLQ